MPRDASTRGIRWEEALWESEHDTEDAVVKALLASLGATSGVVTHVVGYFLDLLLDTPLYLTESGVRIRRRVRSVIAAHPGCIVVGHSLGSVIAADVLARSYSASGVPLDVGGFVTVGSPLNLLGLRVPLRSPFPFTWENHHYRGDPICFSGSLDTSSFPGVQNFELSRDEGFGVAHTHYWTSQIVANSIRRMSRRGR
jgi:pimeloyl-ACP methyl ester carboxylesterase